MAQHRIDQAQPPSISGVARAACWSSLNRASHARLLLLQRCERRERGTLSVSEHPYHDMPLVTSGGTLVAQKTANGLVSGDSELEQLRPIVCHDVVLPLLLTLVSCTGSLVTSGASNIKAYSRQSEKQFKGGSSVA